jgi:type III restriction enzyme
MAFRLKLYQEACIEKLAKFLELARKTDAKQAFMQQTGWPYREIEDLPGLPYVCVRIPTGGGKTVLAAHSIGLALRHFIEQERTVVLWLAPSNTIVSQTLRALNNRQHPYRQALENGCESVQVIDIQEALYVTRGQLDSDTVVIVSTLQALRVEETEGRKVYESSGVLQHHFTGLADNQLDSLRAEDGTVAYSLANVLKLRRPMVIVDEAHNARTSLSFSTLERFSPSCILEFTATPDDKTNPSNVLYSVSAAELKSEAMIKLPVYLRTQPDWKQALAAAIERQALLERAAKKEQELTGEYIRPIVLFQAQQQRQGEQTVTWEVLLDYLTKELNIPAEQIAVHTGARKDLDKLADDEILDPKCPLRYVITVQALKEGWDCPFAYVFCSVHNLSSRTAVEQILGRVLRMPKAHAKKTRELNYAYAFSTSQSFAQSARGLVDALVDSGFNPFEARTIVRRDQTAFAFEEPDTIFEPVAEGVLQEPDLSRLSSELQDKLRFEPLRQEVVYTGPALPDEATQALIKAFSPLDHNSAERLVLRSQGKDYVPAALGKELQIPALSVTTQGELVFFEDQFRDRSWSLRGYPALLTEEEFSLAEHPVQTAVVDVGEKGKLSAKFTQELDRQLSLLEMRGPQTPGELTSWLDSQIPHPDLTIRESWGFISDVIAGLTKNCELAQLVKHRFRLRDAIREKIEQYRTGALTSSFMELLASDDVTVEPTVCFKYPIGYPANRLYDGPHRFRKHFYEFPGHMNKEEADFAVFLDSLPQVQYWVRNLERNVYSFWLPIPIGRFYPDFVALLADGRFLVVESKGAPWVDTADTKIKKLVGEKWAAKSAGRCVFRLVTKDDYEDALRAAVQ